MLKRDKKEEEDGRKFLFFILTDLDTLGDKFWRCQSWHILQI